MRYRRRRVRPGHRMQILLLGFIHFDLKLFTVGAFVSRITFFMMFALALRYYGENIRTFMEKHLPLATGILLFFIIGGFLLPAFI